MHTYKNIKITRPKTTQKTKLKTTNTHIKQKQGNLKNKKTNNTTQNAETPGKIHTQIHNKIIKNT